MRFPSHRMSFVMQRRRTDPLIVVHGRIGHHEPPASVTSDAERMESAHRPRAAAIAGGGHFLEASHAHAQVWHALIAFVWLRSAGDRHRVHLRFGRHGRLGRDLDSAAEDGRLQAGVFQSARYVRVGSRMGSGHARGPFAGAAPGAQPGGVTLPSVGGHM